MAGHTLEIPKSYHLQKTVQIGASIIDIIVESENLK